MAACESWSIGKSVRSKKNQVDRKTPSSRMIRRTSRHIMLGLRLDEMGEHGVRVDEREMTVGAW